MKLKKVPLAEIKQPKQGKIVCLIRFQYAVFHSVYEQAVRHLLLLKNKFRYATRRSHCAVKGSDSGIECKPKCVENVIQE